MNTRKNNTLSLEELDSSDSFISDSSETDSEVERIVRSPLSQARRSTIFKADSNKLKAARLAQLIAYSELNQAEIMLETQPELLLITVPEVTDYSNRVMKNVTAFQVALRAHDIDTCIMIMAVFDTLPNGDAEKHKQYSAEYSHIKFDKNNYFDFSLIMDIIRQSSDTDILSALNYQKNDSFLSSMLAEFRTNFTERSLADIHFNLNHLIKAFQLYETHYPFLTERMRTLYSIQVIGYVQRYLPACYAHGVCRKFNSHFFFPLLPNSNIGYDRVIGGHSYSTLTYEESAEFKKTLNHFAPKVTAELLNLLNSKLKHKAFHY